jgi:WD40 repeat protein
MKSFVAFNKQEIGDALKAYGDLGLLLQGPENTIRCMDITEDNKFVVTGADDNCIYIWSLENFHLVKRIEGHKHNIYRSLVTKDLKRLITCSEDKTIKIWEFGSFSLLRTITSEFPF